MKRPDKKKTQKFPHTVTHLNITGEKSSKALDSTRRNHPQGQQQQQMAAQQKLIFLSKPK